MKIIDIKQDTKEWHAFRMSHIGSSDTPKVARECPYMTPYQLWLNKLGFYMQPQTEAMKRGKELEIVARDKFNHMMDIDFSPAVAECEKIPYLAASFDGIAKDRTLVPQSLEIKCSTRTNHEMVKDKKCPQMWYGQLQKQIYILEQDFGYLAHFDGEELVFMNVYRDQAYIDKMLEREEAFWQAVRTSEPPELTEKDYNFRGDFEWEEKARLFQSARDKKNQAERDYEAIKEWLILSAEGKNTKGGGITLTKVMQKGRIDMKKIIEDYHVDEDKYRKSPVEYMKIS